MQYQVPGTPQDRAAATGGETRRAGKRTGRTTAFAAAGLTALFVAATAGCSTTALGAPTPAASLGASGASAGASAGSTSTANAGTGTGQGTGSGTGVSNGTGSGSGSGSGGSSGGTSECTASNLSITALTGPSGDTHVSELLHFSNIGSHSCFLRGYPGVAQLRGSQVLQNAVRTASGYLGGLPSGQSIPTVVLDPGHSATALVEAENAEPNGSTACAGSGATGLLVTAPDQTTSTQLQSLLSACADFQVHPIVGATGSGNSPSAGGLEIDITPEGGISVTPGGSSVSFTVLLHNVSTTDYAQVGLVVSFAHCSCTTSSLFPAGTLTVDDPRFTGAQSAPYNAEGFGTDFLNETAVPAIAIMAGTTDVFTFHMQLNSSASVGHGTSNVDVTLTDAANNQPVGASPLASLPISVS